MRKEPYEGSKPYLFISYCHEDERLLEEMISLFDQERIRYWYDSGMYSGAFWRRLITEHLKNASACLFLCTSASCRSENVMDELEFAKSYRIPLMMVIEGIFEIKLMTGRTHRTLRQQGHEKELLHGIPTEVYDFDENTTVNNEHPLYIVDHELYRDKETIFSHGTHRTLGYQITVQNDILKPEDHDEAWKTLCQACKLHSPQFPIMYDAFIVDNQLTVFEEYRDGYHLTDYLKTHQPTQKQILDILRSFVNGLKYLHDRSLAIRFFSSERILICPDSTVYFERIHNLYYGVCQTSVETIAYYLEKMLEETGVMLSWLTTGEMPRMPLRLVENSAYSQQFLNRVNMIIQRCQTGPQGRMYASPDEVLEDLVDEKISLFDLYELHRRKRALELYENELRNHLLNAHDIVESAPVIPVSDLSSPSLEILHGFASTTVLGFNETTDRHDACLCIEILPTGRRCFFAKTTVLIGRGKECDMIINQMYISQRHAKIIRREDSYMLEDLHSTNGSYLMHNDTSEVIKDKIIIHSGDIIKLGKMELRIYTGTDAANLESGKG